MNILSFDNFMDHIGPLAELHGMTREEYVAYYMTESTDNPLGLMMYEKYQTYKDYQKNPNMKFGSPADLLDDVKISTKHILPSFDDKWIKSIEDQSDDEKGIKFEIKLSTGDTIHAFKVGSFRFGWEFYLNKKKMNADEIKRTLVQKAFTPYEIWQMNFDGFDKYYMFSDDSKAYNSGSSHEKQIMKMYDALSSSDKKKAYKYYTTKEKDPIDFLQFRGI